MSIFNLSSSTMGLLTGYMGDLVMDLMPLIMLVAGVSLGLWIIAEMFNIFARHKNDIED